MRQPKSIANRLALLFFAITLGAMVIVYAGVVPRLESNLTSERTAQLSAHAQRFKGGIESKLAAGAPVDQIDLAVRAAADQANARVTLIGVGNNGKGTAPFVKSDSDLRTSIGNLVFPAGLQAIGSGSAETAVESISGGRVAEAALPLFSKDPESGRRSPHLGLLALVVVSPLLWSLYDWWEVGEPLYALTATSSLAAELGRDRGIAKVPSTFVDALIGVLRTPQLLLIAIGIAIEIFRRRAKSFYLPLGLIAIGIITFVCVGIFGLSLLPRYLTIPSITLLLFAGYALAGWVELEPRSTLRRGWALAALVVVLAGAGLTIQRADSFNRAAVEIEYIAAVHDDLEATLADPKVVSALRCGPLSLPAFGLIPESLWIRNSAAGSVGARADVSPTRGVALVFIDPKTHRRYGRADGVPIDTDFAPRGFKLIAKHGRISAWASCR